MKGSDAVLHLAALIAIPFSCHSPDTYVDTNIKDTFNVLQAARDISVKRVIHTSTSEVYGTARFVPITEEHPLQGQSPYSATKITADRLREAEDSNPGTFTNFSQNDQALYALHTYLMYLKFGFGRANQDACIEVRRGAMDREQAVNLVRLYDGHYPEEFIQLYLDYYQMTQAEFDEVIDRYANQDLFEKIDGRWKPRFLVG